MAQQPSHTDAAESGLKQASEEVKLAVDLIYLLETHEIAPEIALAALDIVKQDLQGKLNKK